MLIDLKLDKKKVEDWNHRIDECTIEYPNHNFEFMRVTNDDSSYFHRIDRGIYSLQGRDIKQLCDVKSVKEYNSFQFDWGCYYKKYPNLDEMNLDEKIKLYNERTKEIEKFGKQRNNYGLCDNVDQILKEYPELLGNDRCFIVSVFKVCREDQSPDGGFRFHNHGEYIGNHDLCYEYLYDQKDVDYVVTFHIYEIELERKPRITNRKLIKARKITERFNVKGVN